MHGIEEITDDIVDNTISNLELCGTHIKINSALSRHTRISLTIRNVPKVCKLNLTSLMLKK